MKKRNLDGLLLLSPILIGVLLIIIWGLWPNNNISVVVANEVSPFVYIDEESGEYVGFEIDVIRAVAERLGKNVSFRALSGPLINSIVKCNVDLVAGYSPGYPERDSESGIRSDGYLLYGPVLVARYDETRFNNSQEAAAFSMVPIDQGYQHYFNVDTMYKLYEDDRDALWVNYFTASKGITNYPQRFKIVDGLTSDQQFTLFVCPNDKWVGEVNDALDELKAEGVIEQIFNRWTGVGQTVAYTPPPTPEPVAAWGNIVPRTACLEERYYNRHRDVEAFMQFDNLSNLLQDMGIEVVMEGEECDFTLLADFELEPICPAYSGNGEYTHCCTGAIVEGVFSIRSGDYFEEYAFEKKIEPSVNVSSGFEYNPASGPFMDTGFMTAMMKELGDLMGQQVYYAVMHTSGTDQPEYRLAANHFMNMDETEAVTILLGFLKSEFPNVRQNTYLILLSLGSRYDNELVYGSDMRQDPGKWEIWWQQQWKK